MQCVGQNAEFVNFKPAVRKVTTGPQTVNKYRRYFHTFTSLAKQNKQFDRMLET